MAKQKRIKNEDPSINLRLPQDLKDQLNEIAIKKNQTVSKFVRNLLGEYLSGELYDEEISFYKQHHFITSLEFIQLVIWIYGKRNSDEYLKEEESILPNIINTLKKDSIVNCSHVPSGNFLLIFSRVMYPKNGLVIFITCPSTSYSRLVIKFESIIAVL